MRQAYALAVGELAAFLGLAAVVICTPGPDTALTIGNTLAGGRHSGIATALGVALGQAVWTVAAAVGVVALLTASQPAFTALRLAGAAYLVYLGLHMLWSAARGRRSAAGSAAPPGNALRQGLVSNLANPKMAVFFTSLLPQFGSAFATLLAFGLLFALLTFLWLSAYGIAVARARHALGRGRIPRLLEAASGVVLVALGLRLATQPR